MAIWNIGIYSKSITETSKSVLLEILRILSSYREYLVLSGGWAPYFIIERFGEGEEHCGSIDIDFVLDPQLINLRVYETIVSLIRRRGYQPYITEMGEMLPFRFYRTVKSPLDGVEYKIEVDFITEPDVMEELSQDAFLSVQRDLQAVIIRGSSIVFDHNFEHTIRGKLPMGAETSVVARISDVVGCLATKGLALKGRYKEKDAYDIYFVLRYFKGGPEKVAEEISKYLNESVISEAIKEIREKFRSVRAEGPFQVGYFLAPEDETLRERVQGGAYLTVKAFLKFLKNAEVNYP
ncbi:hypothetical protein DRO69_10830 [Candidatus Bathyarchaeota archaeon]|nr:MAG: hypothetical protein DRO69_10830 [Candidatus Bathyarchaeota archaeon]